MARYHPLDLSTQLCYLFDSRKVTPSDFAAVSGCSVAYIEAVTNRPGTRIDWATRHTIGKTLSHFHRLFPDTRPPSQYEMEQRRLKLVTEADNETREGTPRGVREEPDTPPGIRVFKSIDSNGVWAEERRYRAADVTKQIERRILMGMEQYLDAINPVSESMTGDT